MKPIIASKRVDFKKYERLIEDKKSELNQLENDLEIALSDLQKLPAAHVIEAQKETGVIDPQEAENLKARLQARKNDVAELEETLNQKREAFKIIKSQSDSQMRQIKLDCKLANEKTAAIKSKELLKAMDTVRDHLGQLRAFARKCNSDITIIAGGAEVSGPSGQEYIGWRDAELKKIDRVLNEKFRVINDTE